MATTMTVQRDGYFAGTYARRGDIIAVQDEYVPTLANAGFATVEQPKPDEPPPAPAPPPPPQPRKR